MPKSSYQQLKNAVSQELAVAVRRIKAAYQEEFVRGYWNVGRACRESFDWDEKPTRRNAETVQRLSRDFGRAQAFFYDVMKFYRLYPELPPAGLSWSHYALLMRVNDPQKRLTLQERVLRDGISSRDLRAEVLSPAADPAVVGGFEARIPVERGRLYHYRSASRDSHPLAEGRMLVDAGFGIEREVKSPDGGAVLSGRVVRAVKDGEDYTITCPHHETKWLYTYQARVSRLVDGDTLVAWIDLGFRMWVTQTLRLRAIDAPEISTAQGRQTRIFVQDALAACDSVVIKTYKQEKYGRYLADLFYLPNETDAGVVASDGVFLNQELLDKGLARVYAG